MTKRRQPRVLLLHSTVWPYRLPIFERLTTRFDLDVVFCKRQEEGRHWESDLTDYSFNAEILPHIDVGPFVINPTLPERLLTTDYDVYIADGYDPYVLSTFLCLLAAERHQKPFLLFTEHFDARDLGWHFAHASLLGRAWRMLSWIFVNSYQSVLYPRTDGFIAFSENTKRYLLRRGVRQGQIVVGPQVIPRELLVERPTDPDELSAIREDTVTVLYLGHLRAGKGIDTLIQAYDQLNPDGAQLVIAGDGPDRERLKSLSCSRPDVHFVGYVDGEVKAGYYAAADVFVLPTRFDAWGIVVNEAMYFGLPVITTTEAGSKQLIERNGFIIDPDDPDELAAKLRLLIEDESLRREMGARSKEADYAFDPETMVATIEEAIRRVV